MFKGLRTNKKEREKTAHVPTLFSRIQSALTCGRHGKYNLVTKPEPKPGFFRTKPGPAPRQQTFLKPVDAKFNQALCSAGLLKQNIIIKETGVRRNKMPVYVVHTKFEHPVLNICMGFSDIELRSNCRRRKFLHNMFYESFDTEIDNMCRIQVGINRVLFGSHYSDMDSSYDGFSTAMWFDVYDPAVEQFLLMKFRRGRRLRSIFTRRRRETRLIRPPTNSPLTIGDVITHQNLIGPRFFEQQRETRQQRVLIAVMTHRIGELGERQRVNRFNNSIDPVLPFQDEYEREMNHALSRRRRALPSIHRSESNTDQFEPQPRSDSQASSTEDQASQIRLPPNRSQIL